MIGDILKILSPIVAGVAEHFFPNPQDELKRMELHYMLQARIVDQAGAIEQAAAANIQAEIKGESWLQRNWRPVLMVWFAALIGMRWFGFTPPGITETEYMQLWNIIEIGLGGYVIGRSAEKIVPTIAHVFKK